MAKRTETSKMNSKIKKKTKVTKKEGHTYVYAIMNNDEVLYVGSTQNIEQRWSTHISDLQLGKHMNKTLQKLYNENKQNIKFVKLQEIPIENTLMQFFLECLWNSYLVPKANKCIIMQGRARIILQRLVDKELCKLLIDTVDNYYKNKAE